jgi:hypothetical protein
MSLLRRGIISSGNLDAGGATTFATNVADLDGVNQNFTYPDGVCAGLSIMSIECFVNLDSFSSAPAIYKEQGVLTSGSRLAFQITTAGRVRIFSRDGDGGSFIQIDTNNSLSLNTDYHILCVVDSNANTVKFYVNGSLWSNLSNPGAFNPISPGAYNGPSSFGGASASQPYNGRLSFIGIYNTDKSSVVASLYNDGDATCYTSRTTAMKSGELFFTELANWSGHIGGELTEHVGALTITNNNSTPFTGTGPTVEC